MNGILFLILRNHHSKCVSPRGGQLYLSQIMGTVDPNPINEWWRISWKGRDGYTWVWKSYISMWKFVTRFYWYSNTQASLLPSFYEAIYASMRGSSSWELEWKPTFPLLSIQHIPLYKESGWGRGKQTPWNSVGSEVGKDIRQNGFLLFSGGSVFCQQKTWLGFIALWGYNHTTNFLMPFEGVR